MPFEKQIASFIDEQLLKSSLSKKKLQPIKFNGVASLMTIKGQKSNELKIYPCILSNVNSDLLAITINDKFAIQSYHRILGITYSYDKINSYGDSYLIRSVSEMVMVLITNSKISGLVKEALEPLILFGFPQKVKPELQKSIGLSKAIITPTSANLNQIEVFKIEYPNEKYFLNEQIGMLSFRYKIELTYSAKCLECLCE